MVRASAPRKAYKEGDGHSHSTAGARSIATQGLHASYSRGLGGTTPYSANTSMTPSMTPSQYSNTTGRASDYRTGGMTSGAGLSFSRRHSLIAAFDDARAATLKGRTIAPYVHTDFGGVYESMDMYGSIFNFVDAEMEHAFYEQINDQFGPQLVAAGIFGLCTGAATTIILTVGLVLNLSRIYPVYAKGLAALETINLVMSLFLLFYSKIRWTYLRTRNEFSLYLGLGTTGVASTVFSMVVITSPQLVGAPFSDILSVLYDGIATALFFYMLIVAGTSSMFPCRVKYLVFYLLTLAITMTGVIVTFGVEFQSLTAATTFPTVAVALILGVWSWAVLFFGSRCMSELRERIDFYQFTSQRKRVRKMAAQLKEKAAGKKKGSGTAVEDVLAWIKKAAQLIQLVETEIQNIDLKEANKLLDSALSKLTNTDKLFKMNFDGVSTEEQTAMVNVVQAFAQQGIPHRTLHGTFADGSSGTAKSSELAKVVRGKYRQATIKGSLKMVDGIRVLDPDSLPLICQIPECVLGDQLNSVAGRKWSLNLLTLAESNPNILLEVGTAIVSESLDSFGVELEVFQRLFYEMQKTYFANPYHNATHGATVAHTSLSLCRTIALDRSPKFDPIDEMTFIVAALGHDLGHPGRNNAFFVNIVHPLAVLYNDCSILENFHCAIIFDLLSRPECNIFEETSLFEFQVLRSRVIDLVLATDMKMHFEGQSKFRVRRASPEFDFDRNVDDLWLMLKMCLKAADLSHGALEWSQHVEWSMRVTEEFYKQGDEEMAAGMPKSPLCDRDTHVGLAKSQKGFIEFVVQPLFFELDATANGMMQSTCMMRLAENKVRWEERASLQVVTPMPEAVSVIPTHVRELKAVINHLASSISLSSAMGERSKTFFAHAAPSVLFEAKVQVNQETQTDAAVEEHDVPLLLRGLSTAVCNVGLTPVEDSLGNTPVV